MIDKIETQDIKKYNYKETAISDGAITGVCEFGTIEIELFNDNNKYSNLENKWASSKFGDIYIYKAEPDQATMNIRIECYDSRYKLDKEYDKTLYSFPMTLREYRNKVFEDSGLSYKNDDSFPNENEVLNSQPYVGDNPTNRDVIKVISQAALSIIAKTDEDIYYFTWFDDNDIFEVEDSLALTTDSEYTEPLNLMILGRGNTEDNVYYPSTPPTEKHEFRIDNNYILDPQDSSTDEDKKYDVIKPLYDRINGLKYVIYNMRTTFIENKLDIKLGSKIKFFDREGKLLESYVMSKEINYLGGDYNNPDNYEVILSAEAINETNTEVSYASSVKNDILRVERKADKNAGIIQDTVSKVEEVEKETTTNKEVQGYPVEVENAGPYDIDEGIIYGRSEQEVIEASENLLPVNKPSYTINGIEVINNNDGTYTLNGTATDNTYIDLYEGPTLTLQPNTYTGSLGVNENFYIRYGNGTYKQLSGTSSDVRTFTITEPYNFTRIYVYAQKDTIFNNEIIKPMLNKGSVKANFDSYFAGMPSPENKSEIKNVKPSLIRVTGRNIYDKEKNKLVSGNINDSGINTSSTTTYRSSSYMPACGGHFYIGSYDATDNTYLNVVACYDKDKNFIVRLTGMKKNPFFLPTNTRYIRICFYNKNGVNLNNLSNVQIEFGDVAHPYEEFKENTALIDMNKDNIFNGNVETGSLNNNTGEPQNENRSIRSANFINVEADNVYTIKNNNNYANYIFEYDSNKNFIAYHSYLANPVTFVTTANTKYIKFRTVASRNENDLTTKFEIYEGTNADSYYELCSSKDLSIADEYEMVSGLLTKKINKVILNGTENGWTTGNDGFNSYYIKFKDAPLIDSNLVNIMCDYFKGIAHIDRVTAGNNIVYFTSTGLTYFRNTDFSTLNEFKEWLSNNPITIEYILAEPKAIQLKPTNLKLFEGYNLITIDSDIEPTKMFIKYLTDSKLNEQYTTRAEWKIANNEISAKVAKKVNDEDLTGAELVLRINEDESETLIKSDKLDIEAIATFTNNKLKDAGSTIINGSNITTGTISANRINGGTITGSSINLGDGNFKADINGKVDCSNINATGGTLGGWTITSDSIRSLKADGYQVGICDCSNGNHDFMFIYDQVNNKYPLLIRANGWVHMENAEIQGTIYAGAGTIGGWEIVNDAIRSFKTPGYQVGICDCSNGNHDFIYIYDHTNDKFPFIVRANGWVHMENADVTGVINATSGSFTGTVNATSGTFTGTVKASSGNIGNWSISNGSLYGSSGGYKVWLSPGKLSAQAPGDTVEDLRWYDLVFDYSDKRLKNNITDINDKYEQFYNDLKPTTFKYDKKIKPDNYEMMHFGFVAQDIAESIERNNLDNLALVYGKKYYKLERQEIIALNTWQIQKIKKEQNEQKNILEDLKRKLERLEEKLCQ